MPDSEELLDSLELFYFAVRLIGEDLNFLDIFRNGLAKILRSRVERFILIHHSNVPSTPRISETSFVHSESYHQLLGQVTTQLRDNIDSIRKAKLWIPQGAGGHNTDPAAVIASVVDHESFGINELHTLRSVAIDKLTLSPELTIYYNCLFKASMAQDQFTRQFAYAMMRSAPQLFDSRHVFNVLKDALKIWNANQVTFEFAACLALIMNSICDIIHNILDDEDTEQLLYGLIETIPKNKNFSLLIDFDPTFKWILKSLPMEAIKRVLDSSLDQLKNGSYAHLCLICRSISNGIFGFDVLIPALQVSLPSINLWSKSIQREAKVLFGALATRLPQKIINEILNLLSNTFNGEIKNSQNNPKENAEIAVNVFSDFISNYMLNTTAPFHEKLFDSIQNMLLKEIDATRIFNALCANPVRLLESVERATNKSIFSKLQYKVGRKALYKVLFAKNETSLLSQDETVKSLNNFFEIIPKLDEVSPLEFSVMDIETCSRIGLWPSLLPTTANKIETYNEDLKYYLIQLIYIVAIRETNRDILISLKEFIPSLHFECEYSEMVKQINSIMEKKPNNFEILKEKASTNISEVLEIGSKTLVTLSLLFQYVIWSEPGYLFVCFKRTRINSTEWFAFIASSLFVTIFNEPIPIIEPIILKFMKESNLYIVWFAVVILRKLHKTWLNALADESFEDITRLMLYPKIMEGFTDEDIQYAISLHQKYQNIFSRFYNIINL